LILFFGRTVKNYLCEKVLLSTGAVHEAREANLNEITEVQQNLKETKDAIAALKKQLNEIHEHDAVLK
jgi:hypothetical protein